MKLGDPKVVGDLMRKRRHDLGYTIAQMAEVTGLSPITIMRLELGRVSYIHAATARALEVPKKIVHRMTMVPSTVAITHGGDDVTLPPLNALLHGPLSKPGTADSGDQEAMIPDVTPPAMRDMLARRKAPIAVSRPRRQRVVRPMAAAPTAPPPPLKRALLWLASKV